MKRLSVILSVLLSVVLIGFSSCKETKEFDDHANWKQRNSDYIENLNLELMASSGAVTDPKEAKPGQLFKLLSYTLDPDKSFGNGSYVYCRVIEQGTGTENPNYTDSVRFNYRARLIPTDYYPDGQVVDQSFKTSYLDPSVNIPTSFAVSGLIEGVITALMHMRCGDYWKIYIPYELGYGTSVHGTIPGYSTLIYEINLTEIAHTEDPLSPR